MNRLLQDCFCKANNKELRMEFFNNLVSIEHQERYGHALHDLKEYQWLEELFVTIMSNATTRDLMFQVKEWDLYTYQHSFDVFLLSSLMAKRLGVVDIEEFSTGALLHDVGKIRIPQNILAKPGKLTPFEFDVIKNHTVFGYLILLGHDYPESIAYLARDHHEKNNGTGYPTGLTGKEMPKHLPVLSIADIYSALTLDRPYRKAFNPYKAMEVLLKEYQCDDPYLFQRFFMLLGIYPLHSIVELTDGRRAQVIGTFEKRPFSPLVRILDDKEETVVINRTLTVKRIIEFSQKEGSKGEPG
ncbi:HD-GYP domain-containing protein [Peribacillus acanthi]|uniref:HD-GYP domain-containing protein n=1 Tax=Peribacillus acanthi TaxID=2171554 RepID=UPI0013008ECA|nr:HD-GYP domain-containing protein [Peribacillus acanthi]